jgi:hypothetical protein
MRKVAVLMSLLLFWLAPSLFPQSTCADYNYATVFAPWDPAGNQGHLTGMHSFITNSAGNCSCSSINQQYCASTCQAYGSAYGTDSGARTNPLLEDQPENSDAVWPKLRIWIDRNHDGISQPDELYTLPSLGITSLGLSYTETPYTDQFGNRFRYKGVVNPEGQPATDHVERVMYDVILVLGNQAPAATETNKGQKHSGARAQGGISLTPILNHIEKQLRQTQLERRGSVESRPVQRSRPL